MSQQFYVYSTISASVIYDGIEIGGGANIANKYMWTPSGVVTAVDEGQLARLKQNRVFQLHEKNGFLRVEKTKVEVEKVVSGMQGADASAPDSAADSDELLKKTGTKTKTKG